MKKILIAVLSAGVLVVSCTKEAPEVLPEVSNSSDETEYLSDFAVILSRAVVEEPALRDFIKGEALSEFDNDYDVFYAWTKDKKVSGGKTFGEIISQYDYEGKLPEILAAVPTLTVLVPDWSWIDENCFSVKEWDTTIDQVGVSYRTAGDRPVYSGGELVTTLESDAFPEYPVLIVKSNERMKMTRAATRGSDAEFAFVDEAFDGLVQTKGHGIVHEKYEFYQPVADNKIPLSELKGRLKTAYSEHLKNGQMSMRDHVYYGMTATKDEGYVDNDYMETIRCIKLTSGHVDGIYDDQDNIGKNDFRLIEDLWTQQNHYPINGSWLPVDDSLLDLTWGEGNLDIRIRVDIGPESYLYTVNVPFNEAFAVRAVRQDREENWLGATMWRNYHTTEEDLEPKWIYFENPVNMFTWDLTKYPTAYYVEIYEFDDSATINKSFEHTNTYATNFKYSTSAESKDILKVGYEWGGTMTEEKKEAITVSYEEENDILGSFWVHYETPFIKGVESDKADMRVYTTVSVDVMIMPEYILN